MIRVLLSLLLVTLYASAGWHPLKNHDLYKPEKYHLKSGVGYVELRLHRESSYLIDGARKYSTGNSVVWKAYRKSLPSYGSKIAKTFRNIKMIPKAPYKIFPGSYHSKQTQANWYHNGLMLDTHNKIWRLETYHDLIEVLTPIDTPAELALVLWVYRKRMHKKNFYEFKTQYRKSPQGYSVLEDYQIPDETHGGCYAVRYQYTVNRSGKITQRKRLKKRSVLCTS